MTIVPPGTEDEIIGDDSLVVPLVTTRAAARNHGALGGCAPFAINNDRSK